VSIPAVYDDTNNLISEFTSVQLSTYRNPVFDLRQLKTGVN